jgi:exopolyphosphatase/guanosine-5'-triphosphate,3'-diphosphate pyrophosphatase
MPRDVTGVAFRCPFDYPAVIETAPVLSEGAPNPTLLYVTCPVLAGTISRAEAAGAVRRLRSSSREDAVLRDLLEQVTRAYRGRRSALHHEAGAQCARDPRLGAGIGGPEGPETASCLHAYAAALLAVRSGWLVPEEAQAVEAAGTAWERLLPSLEECWCKDARCAKWDVGVRRAAIDVGTISVRLLVADLAAGWPVAAARQAEVTRLGEGLVPGGPLNKVARLRTAEVVERFATQARQLGAENIVLAGTSATREAADGREFIEGLGHKHGLDAVVLSGEREAELAYAGACLDVPNDPVVLDVGGGSTELITCLPDGRVYPVSLPLGASRATDKWVKSDPPAAAELESVAREASRAVAEMRGRFGAGGDAGAGAGSRRLVGVAGTVTTLAALAAGLEAYDPEVIHLRTLSLDEVRGLLVRLAGLTTKERAALPCVQAGRAPVIVAGTAIVLAAMEVLGYDQLTVSERDLLDGLVMEGA